MRQRVGTDEAAAPTEAPGTASASHPGLVTEPGSAAPLATLGRAVGNRALGRIVREPTQPRSANAQAGLRDHFQVISTGQKEHDLMVSGQSGPGSKTGTLEDALTAAKP